MNYEFLMNDPELNSGHRMTLRNILDEINLKRVWRREMEENKGIQKFLQQFKNGTDKEFIEYYLDKKFNWHRTGDCYIDTEEEEKEDWMLEGEGQLEAIQQKKLFDLQCQWRAKKIDLEGITISIQFDLWGSNIFNCPYISPVSIEDIEKSIPYLLERDESPGFDGEWQDYNDLKKAYTNEKESNCGIPDWYVYHDEKYGTKELIMLPDLRGEKEEEYYAIFEEFESANEEIEKQDIVEREKMIDYRDSEIIELFIKRFESKKVLKQFNGYKNYDHKAAMNSISFNLSLHFLSQAEETVGIETNSDWRKAIIKAWNRYRRKKIVEYLPAAFEEYKLKLATGVGFEADPIFNSMDEQVESYTAMIIKSRIIKGEAGDLNY